MKSIETEPLQQSHLKNFFNLKKEFKLNKIKSEQIVINTSCNDNIGCKIINSFEINGFSSVDFKELFVALAKLAIEKNINLSDDDQNRVGKQIVNLLENNIAAEHKDGSRLFSVQNKAINDWIGEPTAAWQKLSNDLLNNKVVVSKVIAFLKKTASEKLPLVVKTQSFGQFKNKGPRILITDKFKENDFFSNRNADKEIVINKTYPRWSILKEIYRFASLEEQRRNIEQQIKNHEINTIPKFTLNKWPKDNLMLHIRNEVENYLDTFEQEVKYFGDKNDLKYQVLFRLTSYPISQLFENGELLENNLRDRGAYRNWRNIININQSLISSFALNKEILKKVSYEQYKIITQRLQNSHLPLDEILTKKGLFAEQGWTIKKQNGQIFAVQEDGITAHSSVVELVFSEIETKLANDFHNDLHYIHTPRADKAFGLFIKGENVPFLVLAIEKIDRPYKKNVLLYQGYDPNKCFDLTRLYSKPGTPGNTSSSMFSLTFSFLKQNYKGTQAILSSFMPSYATGLSMTSGGFNNPVLVKPNEHQFAPIEINGETCYEHVTKRRQENKSKNLLFSQVPLLPTVELMSNFQPPRFKPLTGANKLMLELI